MSATERQTSVAIEIREQELVQRTEIVRERMARSDGEITAAEPNGEEVASDGCRHSFLRPALEAAVIEMRQKVAETADLRNSKGYRGSKRVPRSLIDISSIAIAPEMVSIGPFHRGKEELVEFESSKLWFLNQLLSRIKGPRALPDRLGELFESVQKLESEAREFYGEDVLMSSTDFIEMMVLDGCFLIELFRHDHIFTEPCLIPIVTRDLLKLENQLPFFILEELFNVTAADAEDSLSLLALKFFNLSLPRPNEVLKEVCSKYDIYRYSHLLHLFYTSICHTSYPSNPTEKYQLFPFPLIPAPLQSLAFRQLPPLPPLPDLSGDIRRSQLWYWSISIPTFCFRWSVSTIFCLIAWSIAGLILPCNILLYCLRWSITRFFSLFLPKSEEHRHSVQSIQSITQLIPSGVKFKPYKANSFLQIRFTNRVLQIPPIIINDLTITVFVNCIAYEHLRSDRSPFTHYISFLRCLINSPKDVAFLCAEGIITSYSQNDFYIARLFNQLGERVYINRNNPGYLDKEFEAVEAYYNSHWATFMRTYFSTPWSFISVVSAAILLLLTGGQTALAVLSYINKRSS